MPCLDENLALRFVSGHLEPDAARQVEQHVSECADCRWLISSAGAAVLEEQGGPSEDATTDAAIDQDRTHGSARRALGEVLNSTYVIERFLGEGGMGTVYEACHRRLPRRFALKFLSSDRADRAAIARLRQEAEVTSRLAHPHVVEVFDFNITEDGVPFLVMELLQGESLTARLKRVGAIDNVSLFVTIVREICAALVAVHERGIVHRDLKPSNIFLCERDGRTDFIKVMDFGISKVLGAASELTSNLAVMGSPSYMAPEQASGRSSEVNPRADIFSLGAIMFRILAGQPPFVADSVPTVIFRLVYEDPTPTPRWKKIPRPIREVILHALREKPDDRPPDVGVLWTELVEAFHRAGWAGALVESLDNQTRSLPSAGLVPSPTAELLRRSGKRRRRQRWPWAAGAGLLLAAGAVTLLALGLPGGHEQRGAAVPSGGPRDGGVAAEDRGRPDHEPRRPPADAAPLALEDDAGGEVEPAPPRAAKVRHGKLTVQTRTADGAYIWADVFLDGRRVGRTPLTLPSVRTGAHEVTVSRQGYQPVTRTVRVKAGRTVVGFPMRQR